MLNLSLAWGIKFKIAEAQISLLKKRWRCKNKLIT